MQCPAHQRDINITGLDQPALELADPGLRSPNSYGQFGLCKPLQDPCCPQLQIPLVMHKEIFALVLGA